MEGRSDSADRLVPAAGRVGSTSISAAMRSLDELDLSTAFGYCPLPDELIGAGGTVLGCEPPSACFPSRNLSTFGPPQRSSASRRSPGSGVSTVSRSPVRG